MSELLNFIREYIFDAENRFAAHAGVSPAEIKSMVMPKNSLLSKARDIVYRSNRTASHVAVYLAGPMTGLPDSNYPAFNAAAAELRANGWTVENPAECLLAEDAEWHDFMRSGITQLMRCRHVVMLPGWEKSRGATIERALALQLDIDVCTMAEFRAEQF